MRSNDNQIQTEIDDIKSDILRFSEVCSDIMLRVEKLSQSAADKTKSLDRKIQESVAHSESRLMTCVNSLESRIATLEEYHQKQCVSE